MVTMVGWYNCHFRITCLVASSRIRILGFFSKALAMAILRRETGHDIIQPIQYHPRHTKALCIPTRVSCNNFLLQTFQETEQVQLPNIHNTLWHDTVLICCNVIHTLHTCTYVPLLLPSWNWMSLLTNHSLIAKRESTDKLICICQCSSHKYLQMYAYHTKNDGPTLALLVYIV